jgi:ferric-dicitrate binding protein FerR (iron transport regulator)
MTKETIIKFLNNRCTDAELEEVIRWANMEESNRVGIDWAFDDWNSYHETDNLEDDEKFSILFDNIQHKIDIKNRENKKMENGTTAFSLWMTWLTRAAAILLLPVLIFLFYTLSEKKPEFISAAKHSADSLEIIAPIGSRTVVQLPDGSEVYLNFGSKIKYPQIFSGRTREVILTGEGYFNVTHNPENPFVVKTEKLNITALGTVFNVLAYSDDDVIETTLVEGKVVLEKFNESGKKSIIGTLAPGQHVNFNLKTGDVTATRGNIGKYVAWKDGKLVFEDATIVEVAERLSRMFNVDIEIDDDIKDYIYTVTLIDEPLFQILDLMSIATPVTYKSLPRKKLPDGTFSKQKIFFEKR